MEVKEHENIKIFCVSELSAQPIFTFTNFWTRLYTCQETVSRISLHGNEFNIKKFIIS